ncbi:MAG: UDP-N-acetylmuramoyl-L-alanyl-D-glutamate--2,6-diaminopimelate ligase [Lachnospiraceae bacterium]|nr:UDP-N-acetylmuramoyl-L-alanyl-D-glutamate--2,6-diaminopimelate ligase [Lachnospiraceae bacterium]
MKLKELLAELEYKVVKGSDDVDIADICFDSRKAVLGGLYIAITGAVVDGHSFIANVIKTGVNAVVVEKDVEVDADITVIRVDDTRLALAYISAAFFGHPAKKLKTIGITGTKGKTTTTYMVKSILESAGIKTGLIGTIETIIGDTHIPSANTTPESYVVQKTFKDMVDAGLDAVVMEVSSQGLMLNRVAGFRFDYGIFTNLSPDHIGPNEHKDFDDYLSCKAKLFKQCKVGIFNADDKYYEQMKKGASCKIETFGEGADCDYRASDIKLTNHEGVLGVSYHLSGKYDGVVEVPVPGDFSVYNSLTAIAICSNFDVDFDLIKKALLTVNVKGRVELVPVSKRFSVMIDYAHNAMSLESLLTSLRRYDPKRLVCLFGCGGNRSRDRRFEMGEISSKYADFTIVTSDNPRNEDPDAIIEDILVGVKKADGEYVTIKDRHEAIRYAIENAVDGDVIILAGKGHEDYQEINGVKHHMDEREIVADVVKDGNFIK